MDEIQKKLNNQYLYLSSEIDRLNRKVQRIEEDQEKLKHHEPLLKQELNYDQISQSRSIAMIEDKFKQLSTQFDKLKLSLERKVSLTDFTKYTASVAQEYTTRSMLDLSLSCLETKMLNTNTEMKSSITNQKAKQMNKQIQVYEYQHSIEQQVEERMNRFRELIISQVRQFCEQIQAQDISKPFRDQIQNKVTNLHEKLHNVEQFQIEIQRHLEAREFEKMIKKYVEVEERVKFIEASHTGIQHLIKTMTDQKQQKLQEKEKHREKIKQIQSKEDFVEKFVQKEDFTKFQAMIEEQFLRTAQGAQLLQRINEIEDNIKCSFNKEIYEKLQNEINDLDEQFGTIISNLQKDEIVNFNKLTQNLNSLEILLNSRVSRSEIFEMLDNPQSMMKVNSAVQNIQEKFKELYSKQIEILEASFIYTLNNMQAANITENDKINQQKSLLKKCEFLKISLQEYFGQPLSQIRNKKRIQLQQQQSQNLIDQHQQDKNQKIRPQSVGSRKARLKQQSATPKLGSQSFSGSSVEPQFFQRVIQNPLVQKLKK